MTHSPPAMEDLLIRTAVEIARCRSMVVSLEDAVHSTLGGDSSDPSPRPTRDLQLLDLLGQHLQDLALWTGGLAAAAQGCFASRDIASLISPLRLDELRRSLGGDGPPAAEAIERTEVF